MEADRSPSGHRGLRAMDEISEGVSESWTDEKLLKAIVNAYVSSLLGT